MPRLSWSLLLFLVACTTRSEPSAARTAAPVRVLFIGNSYTYLNNLPEMLEGFARALAPDTPLDTEAVLVGGAMLRTHLARGVAPQRIREGNWNHVVLQEQSLLGGPRIDGVAHLGDPEEVFFPAARQLAAQAASVNARPLFFMTWPRKARPEAQAHLTQAYARIADELNAALAPAGLAWERVRREHPELELYSSDGHHPGPAGTYLTACVLFASIFQRPCTGAPSTLRGAPWTGTAFDPSQTVTLVSLPESTARTLQRVASEVALSGKRPETTASTASHPPLPTLPEGGPLEPARLVGTWEGTLSLYAVELGMTPATLHLSLETQEAGLTGQVRLGFSQGETLEAVVAPKVEGHVLSFSFEDPTYMEAPVRLRAVLQDGRLQGVAQAEDPQGGRWYGTWAARPSGG